MYFEIGPLALTAISIVSVLHAFVKLVYLSVKKDECRLKAMAKTAQKIAVMERRYAGEKMLMEAQANLTQAKATHLTISAAIAAKNAQLDVARFAEEVSAMKGTVQ